MTLPASAEPSAGFANSGLATAVPNQFFARVLPQIETPEELVVSVYFFFAQQLKRRSPRYVTKRELAADATLARTLSHIVAQERTVSHIVPQERTVSHIVAQGPSPERIPPGEDALERGLDLAVWRGTLLRARAGSSGREEELYVVNTPANRRALEELTAGDLQLDESLPPAGNANGSGIFALYEQNIRPVSSLIADELKEAEQRYPEDWIRDAFREAVSLNKANWRYIESILRRWEAEGRQDEKPGRDPQVEWLERRYREGKRRLNSRRDP